MKTFLVLLKESRHREFGRVFFKQVGSMRRLEQSCTEKTSNHQSKMTLRTSVAVIPHTHVFQYMLVTVWTHCTVSVRHTQTTEILLPFRVKVAFTPCRAGATEQMQPMSHIADLISQATTVHFTVFPIYHLKEKKRKKERERRKRNKQEMPQYPSLLES